MPSIAACARQHSRCVRAHPAAGVCRAPPVAMMQQVALQGCSSSRAAAPRAGSRSSRTHAGVRVQAVFRLISRPDVSPQAPTRLQQSLSTAVASEVSRPLAPGSEGSDGKPVTFHGVHHVALICENLERSLEFYQGILGLEVNPDRPHHKLPYRGAWLWIGPEMIHLMELPNPDPTDKEKRPEHGGRDRHFCIGVADVDKLAATLDGAAIPYTRSMSGRPAIFFRDPDANTLECVEVEPWR